MARRHEVFVRDEQWEKIKPFIPKRKRSATRRSSTSG